VRLLALVVFATGCFGADPQVGLPCSPEGNCPEGQICQAGTCQLPGDREDARPPPPPDAGRIDARVCDLAALPERIPSQGLASEASEDGERVEKRATFNGDDTAIFTVYKARAPWGSAPMAQDYKIDLVGSCREDHATCVQIDAIPPGGDVVERTYLAVSGLMTARIVNSPKAFNDPSNCAAHHGSAGACTGQANCTYHACNAACVPTGVLGCDAGCLINCGISLIVEDATLVDSMNQACTTYAVRLNL
jgi:hypothetical protein